jgi:hypothetical protein
MFFASSACTETAPTSMEPSMAAVSAVASNFFIMLHPPCKMRPGENRQAGRLPEVKSCRSRERAEQVSRFSDPPAGRKLVIHTFQQKTESYCAGSRIADAKIIPVRVFKINYFRRKYLRDIYKCWRYMSECPKAAWFFCLAGQDMLSFEKETPHTD